MREWDDPANYPGPLRHLLRLTDIFTHQGRAIAYLHVYAQEDDASPEPTLIFPVAADQGVEGVGCVDDVARAAVLALHWHAQTGDNAARRLALRWLDFIAYMQEPDGRFVNFIVDAKGTKNHAGPTSYPGGLWWQMRADLALATAWDTLREPQWLARLRAGLGAVDMSGCEDFKILGLHVMTLLTLWETQPAYETLRREILHFCDRMVRHCDTHFCDTPGNDVIYLFGYHQLPAMARAGRLLRRPEYIAACERTVRHLVAPVLAAGGMHRFPERDRGLCAYDISTLVLGLEELHLATGDAGYRALALRGARWLDGENPAGQAVYSPFTGRCADGIDGDRVNPDAGAESAIEAGFIELARRRMLGTLRHLAPVAMLPFTDTNVEELSAE